MSKTLIAFVVALCIPVSVLSAEPCPAKGGKHLFILSGQSNMRQPLPDAFKEYVTHVFGKDKVIVVTLGHPSQPIKRWYKKWTPPEGQADPNPETNGTLYDTLLQSVKRAIAGKELASVTYIWMQGEADAGKGWGAVYQKSFYGILDQFKKDLNRKEINFVIGRINDNWLTSRGLKDGDVVRAAQVRIGESSANGDWVNTDDLNTGVNPWGIYETAGGHFPTTAYRVLGQRFARKACKLIDPDAKVDAGCPEAPFFDHADDIRTHLAIGKAISGTKPDTTVAGGEAKLSTLVDGQYGSTDPNDGKWLAFSPTQKSVELVVDLGDKQAVTGIGVDILINKAGGALFPRRMTIAVSDDGDVYRQVHGRGISFFYKPGMRKEAEDTLRPQSLLVYLETPNQQGRYVKIMINPDTMPVFVDEIVVNPVARPDRSQDAARADWPGPVIWFDHPARRWTEGLPIGNGRLGAVVFGDTHKERLQLNEESLWAGCPVESWAPDYPKQLAEVRRLLFAGHKTEAQAYGIKNMTARPTSFRSYQPLGDLWLDFGAEGEAGDYRRELRLAEGTARVTYRQGGATLTREAFVSAPDDVLAVRVATDKPGTLAFAVSLTRPRDATVTAAGGNCLHLDGQVVDIEKKDGGPEANAGGSGPGGKHMKFAGRLLVRVDRGKVEADGNQLLIEGAGEAVILLTAATDYNLAKMNFDRTIDPGEISDGILARAAKKTWAELLDAHLAEFGPMFNRVSLQLGRTDAAVAKLPTDARLAAVNKGGDDPGLVATYFQFGRYLLMSSSRRPARLPANLQGIWNDRMWAPWEADYHLDINLEMNYWPAGLTNLPETVEPLMDWLEQLSLRARVPAREQYGSDGWMAFLATNPFGRTSPSGSNVTSQFVNGVLDPMGGAWMSAELFDFYRFTQDRAFLKRLYPILRGACEFVLDTLVAAPDGTLVVAPSESPENNYIDPETKQSVRITIGSTYHQSMVRAVLKATDEAARILGTDEPMRKRIAEVAAKLRPLKVGPDGRLLEWDKPYKERQPGHRHMSHLIGLHPFDLITPATPKLLAAARKSLEFRLAHGGGGTGWSRAWLISMFARLRDGEAAREHCLTLLRRSTLPNLWDICPPFQIDGNFGAAAGIVEILLQSQSGQVDLLPALPKAWASGKVTGLRARGGYEVDIEWVGGKLVRAVVRGVSNTAATCTVRYGETIRKLPLAKGGQLVLDGSLKPVR